MHSLQVVLIFLFPPESELTGKMFKGFVEFTLTSPTFSSHVPNFFFFSKKKSFILLLFFLMSASGSSNVESLYDMTMLLCNLAN